MSATSVSPGDIIGFAGRTRIVSNDVRNASDRLLILPYAGLNNQPEVAAAKRLTSRFPCKFAHMNRSIRGCDKVRGSTKWSHATPHARGSESQGRGLSPGLRARAERAGGAPRRRGRDQRGPRGDPPAPRPRRGTIPSARSTRRSLLPTLSCGPPTAARSRRCSTASASTATRCCATRRREDVKGTRSACIVLAAMRSIVHRRAVNGAPHHDKPRYFAHSPLRNTGTLLPSGKMPSISVSAEPIIQSI